MKHLVLVTTAFALFSCGGQTKPADHPAAAGAGEPSAGQPSAGEQTGASSGGTKEGTSKEFELHDSDTAANAHGEAPSKIKPTKTKAALRLFVIDKKKGPIEGIVIELTSPDGTQYYTEETDAKGYTELLVPVGKTYKLSYLSLGRKKISAKVAVKDQPNLNLKLTLRYKRETYPTGDGEDEPRFVLKGVQFESGKATLTPDSFTRLDRVVEYMTHKKSARIQISGHTDNVGNPRRNKKLSQRRADACRDYLVSKGIDRDRIETVGYGDTRPIAPNDTKAGRQANRRIEATELPARD